MAEVISVIGGGNHNVPVYGNGTVYAGNGNDTIVVHGSGTVIAGSGNDSISVHDGKITVGGGHDTISLYANGTIDQIGAGGFDTIKLGFGNDTITEAGHATVTGPFGTSSIAGGQVQFLSGGNHQEIAVSGNVTLVGGQFSNQFIGGTGTTVMKGGYGPDTFVGGSGSDTMTGGHNKNVFEFVANEGGGNHVITNFVSGHDKLYIEGSSLASLQANHDITVSGGNTYIHLGDGTSIELKGITNLSKSDITTHKP